MINLPLADRIAFRGRRFYQHDAGYHRQCPGTRTYPTTPGPASSQRRGLEKKNFNDVDVYRRPRGARHRPRRQLDGDADLIYQDQKATAPSASIPSVGDLKIVQLLRRGPPRPLLQAALTIEGKIAISTSPMPAPISTGRPTRSATIPIMPRPMTSSTRAIRRPRRLFLFLQDNAGNTIDPRSTSSAPTTSRR
jgi:hypothetical protein